MRSVGLIRFCECCFIFACTKPGREVASSAGLASFWPVILFLFFHKESIGRIQLNDSS